MSDYQNIRASKGQEAIVCWEEYSEYTGNVTVGGTEYSIQFIQKLIDQSNMYRIRKIEDAAYTDNFHWISNSGQQVIMTHTEIDTVINGYYDNMETLNTVAENCTAFIATATIAELQNFNVTQYFIDNCPWLQ